MTAGAMLEVHVTALFAIEHFVVQPVHFERRARAPTHPNFQRASAGVADIEQHGDLPITLATRYRCRPQRNANS